MLEAYGNIWEHVNEYDAVVITTNGYVKKNGEAVMGRGIALEARERYPWLPRQLGVALKYGGNDVYQFDIEPSFVRDRKYNFSLFTFPVKPVYGPNGEPGWRAKADIGLIIRSAITLAKDIEKLPNYKVLMPRPGCGNGGLTWEQVKPIIEPILDDRFTVMEFEPWKN